MEEILLAVMAKLQEISALRWIDINIGQMDVDNPPVDYPCALVDVPDIDYKSAGGKRQNGEAIVEVELFFPVRTPSNMSAPEQVRQQAFEHFKIVKDVYLALQGLEGNNFSGLNRIKLSRRKDYYPRPITLFFRCSVEDHSAVKEYTRYPVDPNIKMRVKATK